MRCKYCTWSAHPPNPPNQRTDRRTDRRMNTCSYSRFIATKNEKKKFIPVLSLLSYNSFTAIVAQRFIRCSPFFQTPEVTNVFLIMQYVRARMSTRVHVSDYMIRPSDPSVTLQSSDDAALPVDESCSILKWRSLILCVYWPEGKTLVQSGCLSLD